MITRTFDVWTGIPDDTSEPDDTIQVTFSVPTSSPEHEDCWYCDLRIDAFESTRVHGGIAGIDGLQAFLFATQFAEAEHGFFAQQRGVTITFLGGRDLFSATVEER